MDKKLLDIIHYFYQGQVDNNTVEYYKTPQYKRLTKSKKEAQENNTLIKKIIEGLRNNFPEYDYRELLFLGKEGTDVCFIFEVLLNKHSHFHEFNAEGDKKTLNETNGIMKTLTVFVSILAPFYTYRILNLWLDEVEGWQSIFEHDIDSDDAEIWKAIQIQLKQSGYSLLDRNTLNERVSEVFLETLEKGQATVFDCLFSELFSVN